jgi:alpha-L-arabinofuranosidase
MPHLIINADQPSHTISRHIYGHFAEHLGRCVYDGLWVGERSAIANTRGWRNDLVAALRNLRVPNLRWPGGNFADTYHWRDGVGPREKRTAITNIHWGGHVEDNSVGTHEFLDLCEQIGAEPYLAGNVGSGTVREMMEWQEYLTSPATPGQPLSPMAKLRQSHGRAEPFERIRLWGVGNENWGTGGNMRASYYVDEYRKFANYSRHYGPGQSLFKIACGLNDEWNDLLIREAGGAIDGLSVHYYTWPGSWGNLGHDTVFDVDDYQLTIQKAYHIDSFIKSTRAILDRYDPGNRIAIVMDEWGTWYDSRENKGVLYQQNTMRDALVAGVTLNIFHHHAARLRIANLAQVVNVLQAVALTDGAKMLLTPTYHVMEMYKAHQDAMYLPTHLECETYVPGRVVGGNPGAPGVSLHMPNLPQLTASASRSASGEIHLTITNLHHEKAVALPVTIHGANVAKATATILTAPSVTALNTFDEPSAIVPAPVSIGPIKSGTLALDLPARSVLAVTLS